MWRKTIGRKVPLDSAMGANSYLHSPDGLQKFGRHAATFAKSSGTASTYLQSVYSYLQTVENHIFDGNLKKMEFFSFKYVQTSFGWDFWTSQWKKKTKCEWNLIILHIILTRSIHLHINVSDVPRNCCVLRGVSENACFKCQLSEKLS